MADENEFKIQDVDYYKLLQDQNYKTLQDREIQLDAARQRAFQNANVGLAAAGFDSSGYGQLNKLGIENQYLQGLQKEQARYSEQDAEDIKATQNYLNEQSNNFMAMMDNDYVTDAASLNKVLSRYGFLDDNNELKYDELVKRYGKDNADLIATQYDLRMDEYNKAASANSMPTNYNESDAIGNIKDSNGNSGNSSGVKDEISFLYNGGKNLVPAEEGTVVMLKGNNKDSDTPVAYLKRDANGNWVQISSEEYYKAGSEKQYEVASDKNTKRRFNVTHDGKTTKYTDDGTLHGSSVNKKYNAGETTPLTQRQLESSLTMAGKNVEAVMAVLKSKGTYETETSIYTYKDGQFYVEKKKK